MPVILVASGLPLEGKLSSEARLMRCAEEYAGKKLTLYTYRITNHPDAEEADASLYVYRSALVGGDVHSTSFTGFMTALR